MFLKYVCQIYVQISGEYIKFKDVGMSLYSRSNRTACN